MKRCTPKHHPVHSTYLALLSFEEFQPQADELYILGPTTPQRSVLASELVQRFGLKFTTLIHPTAYVSPLAKLGQGVFIGANSVIGPGVHLDQHVFVNRGVTVGQNEVTLEELWRSTPTKTIGRI